MITSLLASAAATPTQAPPPGVAEGELLGNLGAGGAALAVTFVLVLGSKAAGKGKALTWGMSFVLGAMAATLYAAAGGIWSTPADLIASVLTSLGVGGGSGPFGNVGLGSAACCCAAWIYWQKLTVRQIAVWGFVMAYLAGRAGGIWGVGVELVEALAQVVGA